MEYNQTNTSKSIYIILFIFMMSKLFHLKEIFPTPLFWFLLVFSLIWILLVFAKSKILLQKNSISYSLIIFGFSIYKKTVLPNHIRLVTFKRCGWIQKCVVIKTNRGMNIRISRFYPESIYSDIKVFCAENNIETKITKDFAYL